MVQYFFGKLCIVYCDDDYVCLYQVGGNQIFFLVNIVENDGFIISCCFFDMVWVEIECNVIDVFLFEKMCQILFVMFEIVKNGVFFCVY